MQLPVEMAVEDLSGVRFRRVWTNRRDLVLKVVDYSLLLVCLLLIADSRRSGIILWFLVHRLISGARYTFKTIYFVDNC